VSEAVGVELQHLDFDEELIVVTGKGAKQRLVPMGSALQSALRRYLEPSGRPSLVTTRSKAFLFLNHFGGPLTRQGVDLMIRRRAFAVGIPNGKVSAHVFRHSCATHMLEHGADIRIVQELLGHASIATTQVYTAVSLGSLQSAYADAHPRAHNQ
jgi:integrase/recombinase XerD